MRAHCWGIGLKPACSETNMVYRAGAFRSRSGPCYEQCTVIFCVVLWLMCMPQSESVCALKTPLYFNCSPCVSGGPAGSQTFEKFDKQVLSAILAHSNVLVFRLISLGVYACAFIAQPPGAEQ